MTTHDAPSNQDNVPSNQDNVPSNQDTSGGSPQPDPTSSAGPNTDPSASSDPNRTHSNPSNSDFMRLLSAARAGDSEATGQLLQWYANYLNILASSRLDRRLARRLNPSDIVQEAMMAAHRDFGDFRGKSQGELLCWLRTILIHTLHRSFDRHLKVEKRDIRREISIDAVSQKMDDSAQGIVEVIPGQFDPPSAAMRRSESESAVAEHLAKLKPDYQQVIQLRIFQGLSFEETAKAMDRSNGAVRMLWLRALDALKMHEEEANANDKSD